MECSWSVHGKTHGTSMSILWDFVEFYGILRLRLGFLRRTHPATALRGEDLAPPCDESQASGRFNRLAPATHQLRDAETMLKLC